MLESITNLWSQFLSIFDAFPEEIIAIVVYLLGLMIALWCWYRLMKRLPQPIGAISWIVVFAILATPTVSEGTNAKLAPAIFGLLFGVLTDDQTLVWSNLSAILFVIGLCLVVGFCWSKYQANKRKSSVI